MSALRNTKFLVKTKLSFKVLDKQRMIPEGFGIHKNQEHKRPFIIFVKY